MKLVYFAWVRERIGRSEEEIAVPASIRTASDLIAWLSRQGDEYAYAFERPEIIRVAADHVHVKADSVINDAKEIAFFPPMTGG